MNAERLHAIVKALKKEMDEARLVQQMQNLVSGLRQVVQNPGQQTQQNLANSLGTMYSAVDNKPSDKFSPAWREALKEIGGEEFFGAVLRRTIEDTIQRNQLTPTVAADELDKLRVRMENFQNALSQTVSAFSTFRIGDEQLAPGECEIGVLIPRRAVDNKLVDFSAELKELAFILNTFSEVATGHADELHIKTISSSDLLIYLNTHPLHAACLATAIERLVALYKSLLEIRKLQVDLRKQGIPDEAAKGIEEHANTKMEKGIDKLSVEIVNEFYHRNDDGRKNELRTAVKFSLNNIANRIDRGYNIEVRCAPLQSPTEEKSENEELKKALAVVQKATANMQFLKLEGDPILRLPAKKGKDKDQDEDGKESGKSRRRPSSGKGESKPGD